MSYEQVIPVNATAKLIEVMIRDSTTGAGKTAIAFGSVAYSFWRAGASSGTNGTCITMTLGSWASAGWKEVSAANQPGVYQFGIPDAALAAGADAVTINFIITGAIEKSIRILLTSTTAGVALVESPMTLVANQHVIVDSGSVTVAGYAAGQAPAKAGEAMTLTSAYDAAKSAASQASVTALGSPMQAGALVALAANQHVIVDSGTITAYTGNTAQTGDVYGLISGLISAGAFTAAALINTPAVGGLSEADVRHAIGMGSANLDVQLAAIAATTSPGPFTVTVTVTDTLSVPLQNARVAYSEGVNRFYGITDALGVVTLNVNAATYVVAASKDGYSFAGGTSVITADTSDTIVMTEVVVVPPADPALCTVYIAVKNGGTLVAIPGVKTVFRLVEPPTGAGIAFQPATVTGTSDNTGLIQVALPKSSTWTYFGETVQVGTGSTQSLPNLLIGG
jgi:hypothetical protein